MSHVLQRLWNGQEGTLDPMKATSNRPYTEEESFDLLSIRFSLERILCKTDYLSFSAMEETCRAVRDVCSGKTVRVQVEVAQISVFMSKTVLYMEQDYLDHGKGIAWGKLSSHVDIVADLLIIKSKLTTPLVKRLIQRFTTIPTRARKMRCEEIIYCKPNQLNTLLGLLKVSFFDSQHQIMKEYFSIPTFRTMNINAVYCNIDDTQLLNLQGENLFMRNDAITAEGINRFLQQWRLGLRKIQVFDLEYPISIGSRDFATVLDVLDANPIWTPDLHHHSVISYIPLNHFPEMLTGDPEHLYSLWRPEDISQILIIRLNHTRIEIFQSESEVDFLLGYVQEYEKQLVFRQREAMFREGRRSRKPVDWTAVFFSLLFSVFLTAIVAHPQTTETLLSFLKQL